MKGSMGMMMFVLCLQCLTYNVQARVILSNLTDIVEERNNATQLVNFTNADRNIEEDVYQKSSPPDGLTEADEDDRFCGAILCGSGRECLRQEGAPPACVCKNQCPDRLKVVCGSDAVTYDNHCLLHRAACLQKIKIHIVSDGPCPGFYEAEGTERTNTIEDQTDDPKPLVCYQIERDQLRQLLIDWLKGKVEAAGWFSRGRSYFEVLTDSFRDCDRSGDDKLNAMEFMQCVERNNTMVRREDVNEEPEEQQEQQEEQEGMEGHVLRGLCVDALIVMSDQDSDWELDLEEFRNCLDPEVDPPKKQCSLEEKTYEDGAEVRIDCNICICACGNWVCTATSCNGLEEDPFELYDIRQGELPTKEERQRLLQGFIAAEHVNLERIELEVPANGSHNYNDVPRPHGHHSGHHGHSHVGHELTNEDQYDVYENINDDDDDGYFYYYDEERATGGWPQLEYYAEYEDEVEKKKEEIKREDEEFYEHHEEHTQQEVSNTESQEETQDDLKRMHNLRRVSDTEEQTESEEQKVVPQEEYDYQVDQPAREIIDYYAETDFESEALIPTQEHQPRETPVVTESTVTEASRDHQHQGHKQGHGHGNQKHHNDHQQHGHNHTHHNRHHDSQIHPVQPKEDERKELEGNSTDIDSLLSKFFPEDIGIRVPLEYAEPNDDVDGDLDRRAPEPVETATTTESTTTRRVKHHKKKGKKNKKTTVVAALPTQSPLRTTTEELNQNNEDLEGDLSPTRSRSILGGRVDITVQQMGTEVMQRRDEEDVHLDGSPEEVTQKTSHQKHHRHKNHRRRHDVNNEDHDVTH